MENILLIQNFDDLWKKSIEKCHISSDERNILQVIAKKLIEDNSNIIQYIINKIVYNEFNKKSKIKLFHQILIKEQIVKNVNENIEILALNTAKKIYNKYNNQEPILTIIDDSDIILENNNYVLINNMESLSKDDDEDEEYFEADLLLDEINIIV